jgi:hypothetical protein
MIRSQPIESASFHLFPWTNQHTETIRLNLNSPAVRPLLPVCSIPSDFTIVHQNRSHLFPRAAIEAATTQFFYQPRIDLGDVAGDFQAVIDYFDGLEVVIDEMNVTLFALVGRLFGIPLLKNLSAVKFVNYNNAVVLADRIGAQADAETCRAYSEFASDLIASGRVGLLPCPLILAMSADSLAIRENLARYCVQSGSIEKTSVAQKVPFAKASLMDFRAMLADDRLNLTSLGNGFLFAFTKTAHPPPYVEIAFEAWHPLNGVFSYLRGLCDGNPHLARLVNIEASSTQIGNAWGIIDYGTDDYFSTKDLPNQWIKIEFRRHRIALTDYVYLTHAVSGNGHSASWLLQGTTDGMHWVDIHAVRNSNHFRALGQQYHAGFPPTDFFAGIRITQTGTNTMNYHNFRVAKLELFGRLRDVEENGLGSEPRVQEDRSPVRAVVDAPRRRPPSIARLRESRLWPDSMLDDIYD